MLPVERQSKILEWLRREGHLKVSDLSRRLNVSEMTVHRDIRVLVQQGRVLKTYGGISLVQPSTEETGRDAATACSLCRRPVNDRLAMTLTGAGGQIETFCCAHCGMLRFLHRRDEAGDLLGRDFLLGHTVGARTAWYVFDSEIHVPCCEPQLLLFGEREHAERFVRGFGGTVLPFDAAAEELQRRMNPASHCAHCRRPT